MALLNNVYIYVETEEIDRSISMTEHSVESGLDLTDNIKRKPVTVSLKGAIVGDDVSATIAKIEKMMNSGKYVKYVGGAFSLNNAVIKDFKTSKSNKYWGGYEYDMEIQEVRIAKAAYTSTPKATKGGTAQVTENKNQTKRYYTIKKGDCLWAIAKSYYGSGKLFTKIYDANRDIVGKNYLIHPGQKLLIP